MPFPTTIDDDPSIGTCHVPTGTEDVQLEQCLCTSQVCGAGMVNANNSVTAADRPIAAIALPSGVSPGQAVALNASGSAAACNRTVASYAWTVVEPAEDPPVIAGADGATASVLAPTSGAITLQLTVTDNLGHQDSAEVTIGPHTSSTNAPAHAGSTACAPPVVSGPTPQATAPTPTPTPTPTPSEPRRTRDSGGGSLELLTLGLLGVWTHWLAARRRRDRIARCN
jgi:hypothetical protein